MKRFGIFLTFLGIALLLMFLIPVTSVEEVINASFTVGPGTKYGPPNVGTGYHTRIFGKSVLRGDVTIEGEGIYLTINGYTANPLRDLYVEEHYSLVVDPADDLYTFTFDNSGGCGESSIQFKLEEIWTRPIVIGSPPLFITGLIVFFTFLAGLIALAITRLRIYLIH